MGRGREKKRTRRMRDEVRNRRKERREGGVHSQGFALKVKFGLRQVLRLITESYSRSIRERGCFFRHGVSFFSPLPSAVRGRRRRRDTFNVD